MKIAFFGTPDIAVVILEELKKAGYLPDLIVANPDAKVGRKQILTPPPTVTWARAHNIATIQPETLKDLSHLTTLTEQTWDLFIVMAYGKIIPKWLVELPKHSTLNVHPSLLPKFRGASPIRSAILHGERTTGVSIMRMDEKMDHGPLLATERITIEAEKWPIDGQELDTILATAGGKLLASIIPSYVAGTCRLAEQDHSAATLCTKITKDMSELSLNPLELPTGKEAYTILCKIRAFSGWPETFFIHNSTRIKIKAATLSPDGTLLITRIIPEGKKEMNFQNYFA